MVNPIPWQGEVNTYDCPGRCLKFKEKVTLWVPGYSVGAWPANCQSGKRTGDVFVYGDQFNQGIKE